MYSRAGGNSSYVSFDMTAKGGGKAIHASNPQDTDIKQALKCTSKPKKTTQMELSQMGGDMYTRAGTSLPTIFIDGPYSSPSEHFFDYKVGVLIAAGIGVTPAASILRSIYFQWLQSRDSLQVKKVYLFWAYRDMHTLEWFKDLLIALSEEGLGAVVEIHTYFTGKVPDSCSPQPSPVGDSFGDMVVSTPIGTTSYVGRPDFDCIFEAVGALHPDTRIGTFFCGPKPMQRIVRRQAHKWNGRLKRETSTYIDFYSEKF
ncbi:hypothetical protein GGH14_005927 [Coemansia sp. RSA 370]|nr:hypothetical protein GGH14_005927 [Coemansia sp. RSA 370]